MLIGILRTILIIIAVYYLVKFIMWIFRPTVKPDNANRSYNTQQKKKEGEITINYISEKKKHIQKDSGDYVDFEEIEED